MSLGHLPPAFGFVNKTKEKDLVDPPALSRIQHFIKRKIAYDLKQIQYAKTVFRYPPQVGFEASWRRLS